MFGDGSWGVAFVSTPGAGHGNLNRITCAYVTGYRILLQGLVTYHAGKKCSICLKTGLTGVYLGGR